MGAQFITLNLLDGDPVAFNLQNVIAFQPHERGTMVWTVPGISDVSWCNWVVTESYDDIGKRMNWMLP